MRSRDFEGHVKSCYSTWGESYHEDYYGSKAAYPPVHVGLIQDLLAASATRRIMDAGCGPASLLRELIAPERELFGFDFTPEMVEEGKHVFQNLGLPPDNIREGSILDAESFLPVDGKGQGSLDAVLVSGVLPHLPEECELTVLRNVHQALRPEGLAIVEARNQLFSLFTLNRYSQQFFRDELIRVDALRKGLSGPEAQKMDQALEVLSKRFRTDLPPLRQGSAGEPGYDQVLSRTHNPLTFPARMAEAGFADIQVLFYHYHCLPPMLEAGLSETFRAGSLALEDPRDWRGHFMASAFMVVGRRQ